MRFAAIAVSIVVAASLSAHASAQGAPKRKPGLWEVEYSMAGTGMPSMKEELAKLSPQERAQAEKALRMQGMGFGATPGIMTMRVCIAPQDAGYEDGMVKRLQRDADCDPPKLTRTASEIRFHSVCHTRDGAVTENDGRVYAIAAERYEAEWTGKSSNGHQMHMQQSARWLGSDCGTTR